MSQSLTQQLADFLKARPHQWIGAREFEQFGRQAVTASASGDPLTSAEPMA